VVWTEEAAIRLCGRFEVTLSGRQVTHELPGRQGPLVLAYLACRHHRPVTRDELIDLIWPSHPPARPDDVLGAVLSKLRRALGPGVIEGRRELTLVLPEGAQVDVELAAGATERAEAALAIGDARLAFDQAQVARRVAGSCFLPGFENPWVEEQRRELEELRLRALECTAGAGVLLGGAELAAAERAATSLITAAPLREPGYRLMMEALAVRGDVAGALQVYERLRTALRDELGIPPGPAVRALHERLLAGDAPDGNAESHQPAPVLGSREERKLVTVLAAELQDSGSDSDPEDLRAAHTRVHEHVLAELHRFGATVRRTGEGEVAALFGAPVAHEDDAERAIRAALRIRELDLAARVGVATGELLVDPDAQEAGIATGKALGDAVRIQREAPLRAVVADKLTVEATQASVSYTSYEDGVSWLVRSAADRLVGADAPAQGRFVGRAAELTLLERLYTSAVETGRPSMVTVLGSAGVGKSRLTDEFLTLIQPSSPSVYRGRCLPYGEGITYWALREILWAATGIRFDDPAAAAAAKLCSRVGEVLGAAGAARVSAALAIASGIAFPENPLARLAPASVADEVALAWPALLSGLAATAPVVVVVEDLHWAEEPLLDMLERVLARSTGRLLLLVTARPEIIEVRAGWGARPGMSQISLEPLTEDASRELVHELLPNATLGARERVIATAEGNPFFAEELARHLSDPCEPPTAIPDTVRALLAARVDRLPVTEKQALQDAAVVGRVFWATTLESIEARTDLAGTLRNLEDRGLVVTRPASSLPGETELTFRHGLTREVAYRSIPRSRRCRAHAAVGQWLEQLAGDRRHEFIDLLAHHYESASRRSDTALAWPAESTEPDQLRAKAFAALIEAGHGARTRLSTEQALRFSERALAMADTARERLAALELQARTHHAAARGDKGLAAYTAGMDLARTLGDHETLARLRAYATLLCVRYAGAFSTEGRREQAIQLIDEGLADDDEVSMTFERGALLVGRSWGLRRRRRPHAPDLAAAKRDAERAIAIAEAIGSPELLAAALEGLTWLVSEEGFCDAGPMGDRLIRASTGSPDRVEAHESKVTAAICFGWAGDFERAAGIAREATIEASSLSSHRALHSAMAQTFCLLPAGRFAEFGQATSAVLELAREDAGDGQTCMGAIVALAGRALWLYEALASDEATSALNLINRVRPLAGRPLYDYFIAEQLRPLVGIRRTRTQLEGLPPTPNDAAATILYLRALLPLLALGDNPHGLEDALTDARTLARSACAPALGWIADWATAVQNAPAAPEASLQDAVAATTALADYGERYTAARLLTEFLPLVDTSSARDHADETANRLQLMGALASAASARSRIADQ